MALQKLLNVTCFHLSLLTFQIKLHGLILVIQHEKVTYIQKQAHLFCKLLWQSETR